MHERIITTLAKAKEMRPIVERVVHNARREDHTEAHRSTKRILYSNVALKRLHTEIAPRFDDMNLAAGFTRITRMGMRSPDRAQMAMIELVGNPLERWEKA